MCGLVECCVCPLCGGGCRAFEPPALHCRGNCGTRIFRNGTFYALPSSNFYVWCESCHSKLKQGVQIDCGERILTKKQLTKKKNNALNGEPWVQCDHCQRWVHQVCALFNARQNMDLGGAGIFHCPLCRCETFWRDVNSLSFFFFFLNASILCRERFV